MKCPNCQAPLLEKIQVCKACEVSYTNAELVEMLQLDFLLAESAKWPNFEDQRILYMQRRQELEQRLRVEPKSVKEMAEPNLLPAAVNTSDGGPVPRQDSLSQWLFSEAAIRLALYGGGLLLVLAGLIFIGANWSNLQTSIKLLVTLSITAGMYGGGFLLSRVSKLRVGGVALLGVASGFVPLNFVVFHIYILRPLHYDVEVTWLVGSAICLFIYLGTTLWTRSHLFTYLSILAALSGITASLNLLDSPFSGYVLVYALIPVPLLIGTVKVRSQVGRGFLYWPGIVISTILLGVVIPALVWVAISAPETMLVTLFLIVIAILYGLVALVTGREWFVLIVLLALNLFVISGQRLIENFTLTPVTLSFAGLGLALLVVAVGLRLAGQTRWAWPCYLFAAFDLASSYAVSLFLDQPWPMVLSFGLAVIALGFSWVEQPLLERFKLPPIHTYIGLFLIFIGHFYLLDFLALKQSSHNWTLVTAGLCSLFMLASWLFPIKPFNKLYGTPLYWVGAGLMIVPAMGALINGDEPIALITFSIIGSAYILDGMARRWIYQVYLGTGAFIGASWYLLMWWDVKYVQAYALPLGLWLIALAWVERYRRQPATYVLLSLMGLAVILGSAFIQSFDSAGYAVLLLVESMLVLVIGLGARTRSYVVVGLISLVLDGLAQFLPAFAEIPRFIQIGSIGVFLLGGGFLALLLREQVINMWRSVRLQLQQWGP